MASDRSRSKRSIGNAINRLDSRVGTTEKATSDPHLSPGAITNDHMAEAAIDALQLAGRAVTEDKIARGAIGTEHLGIVNTITADTGMVLKPGSGKLTLDGASYSKPPSGVTYPLLMDSNGDVVTSTPFSEIVGGLPAGTITLWSLATPPTNWLICDGSAVSRATYATLFSKIGTTYGAGDGSTTFNLPDLKGRVPVGRDTAQTEFDVLGEKGGAKTHTLTAAEMPIHTHTATVSGGGAHQHLYFMDDGAAIYGGATRYNTVQYDASSGGTGNGGFFYTQNTSTAWDGTHTHTVSNANAGGDGAHNNLQPYTVLVYIIKHSSAETPGDSELTQRVSNLEVSKTLYTSGREYYNVGEANSGTTGNYYAVFSWTLSTQYDSFNAKILVFGRGNTISNYEIHIRGDLDATTWAGSMDIFSNMSVTGGIPDGDIWVATYNNTTKVATLYYRRSASDWNARYAIVQSNHVAGTFNYLNTFSGTTAPTSNITITKTVADNPPSAGLIPVIPTSVSVGSGSATVGSRGLITFSGATSVSVNGAFSAAFKSYKFLIHRVNRSTAISDELVFRFRNSGTDKSTASYYTGAYVASASPSISAYSGFNGLDKTYLVPITADIGWANVSADIFHPFESDKHSVITFQSGGLSSTWQGRGGSCLWNVIEQIDGFTIYPLTAGTISGEMQIYGYRG